MEIIMQETADLYVCILIYLIYLLDLQGVFLLFIEICVLISVAYFPIIALPSATSSFNYLLSFFNSAVFDSAAGT